MKTIFYVINRNFKGNGHHQFLFKRFISPLAEKTDIRLITKKINMGYLDAKSLTRHIFLANTAFWFFLKLFFQINNVLKKNVITRQGHGFIQDDVNWRDLFFYVFLGIFYNLTFRRKVLNNITLVFRYTFSSKIKFLSYLLLLHIVKNLGIRITSDSQFILYFWRLEKKYECKIPVNLNGLFPMILSIKKPMSEKITKENNTLRVVGVPGMLRVDKGRDAIFQLEHRNMESLIIRANIDKQLFSKYQFIRPFGFFNDDQSYSNAVASLDFQLFWFDEFRYKHATSSTFFESIFLNVIPVAKENNFCSDILKSFDLHNLVFSNIEDTVDFMKECDIKEIKASFEFTSMRSTILSKFSKEHTDNLCRSFMK